MRLKKIGLLGGTGFVGRHLASHLSRAGYAVRIFTRRGARHRELGVLPNTEIVETNVHDLPALTDAVSGCDTLVNLVGILHESKTHTFDAVHAELPGKIVEACRYQRISRLIHVSALKAAADAPSAYLRSKAAGEEIVLGARDLSVSVARPSVIFGVDDDFLNRFKRLASITPVLPLACPDARFAPVYIGDLATALTRLATTTHDASRRHEFCGPEVFTLEQLVRLIVRTAGLRCAVVGLGDGLSRLEAKVLGHLPQPPMTEDNYLSMQVDNTCERSGFAEMGIEPTALTAALRHLFGDQTRATLLRRWREHAGREA